MSDRVEGSCNPEMLDKGARKQSHDQFEGEIMYSSPMIIPANRFGVADGELQFLKEKETESEKSKC